jgi:hypothetical protein
MRELLDKMIGDIRLSSTDTTMYRLDAWFATAIAAHAIKNNKTLFQLEKAGFLTKSVKDMFVEAGVAGEFKEITWSTSNDSIYLSDNSMIQISRDYHPSHLGEDDEESGDYQMTVSCLSYCEEEFRKIEKVFIDNLQNTSANKVFVLTSSPEGISISSIGSINCPLIRENYPENILNDYDCVVNAFNSPDPFGRLVIISGPAGTGKTYAVKGMITEFKNSTVVMLPPKMVSELDGPTLITTLMRHRKKKNSPLVLIIEDADSCIAPRACDNISSVHSLLNNTDGILGDLLDLRVIATTNQPKTEVDDALLRPGRLCKIMDIGKLSAEDATAVYRRLTKKEDFVYEDDKTLAEVYAEANGVTDNNSSMLTKHSTKKVGF